MNERRGLQFVRRYLPILVVCALAVVVSLFIGSNRYLQRILLLVLLWAAACSSFNIISGYGGQVVFGYMMFIGTGAYTTVILFKFLNLLPWFGMLAGACISALIAFIIGLPTLRLRGAYFAVATVAFPLITIPVLNYLGLEEVTIPYLRRASTMQFTDMRLCVVLGAGLLAINLIIVRAVENSGFGFSLKAIKQNETAAKGMGIDTHTTKLRAFMLSAALAAFMGAIYAFSVQYMLSTHSVFGLFIIVRVLSISIVGGLATLWGPVVGSAILVPLGAFLSSEVGDRYPGVQDIVYGAAIVAAIIFLPEGIWGKASTNLRRVSAWFKPKVKGVQAVGSIEPPRDRRFSFGSLDLGFLRPDSSYKKSDDFILQVNHVSKSFGGIMPLVDVNIKVPRGKVLAIIGPNGAGKTTLFNVINGYLTPEVGEISLEGEDITNKEAHAVCRMGVGRTFQVPQVFSHLTILENIMVGAFGKGHSVSEASGIAYRVAEQFGFSTRRCHDRAAGLSAMEMKVLELSRALATKPSLALVDEPMAGLNLEESDQIGTIIKEMARNGITVIIIEHFVQSLIKFADYMVGLDTGRIVAEGKPGQVISDPHIIEAYLGKKWKARYAKS